MRKQELLDKKRKQKEDKIRKKIENKKIELLKEKRDEKEQKIMYKKQRQYDGTNKDNTILNIHKNLPKRNEKCICGSEKKFKKCCMDKILKDIREQNFSMKIDDKVSENLNSVINNMMMKN